MTPRKNHKTGLSIGDNVLLFHNLPYDYVSELPLSPASGITIVDPPYALLGTPDNDHLPCYVLPGIKLPGIGINNCCLVNKKSEPIPDGISREDVFFYYLSALRLLAPANIFVAGSFQYGGEANPISPATLFNIRSTWQPDLEYVYSKSMFMRAGKLLNRIVRSLTDAPSRLKYALTLFAQVTNGFSLSYQMNVLSLYAALEALFSPSVGNYDYGKVLGTRIGAYLAIYDNGNDLSAWITKHYVQDRHRLSHGSWMFSIDYSRAQERNIDFGMLHEITRISLLGFLSMNADEVSFLNLHKNKFQQAIDNIKPANGEFLQGQKMWLG